MTPLLILRPEPAAAATRKRAAALGIDARCVPLFSIQPTTWEPVAANAFDALMITSVNAVRVGGAALSHYHMCRVLAVGAATAQALRDAGFHDVITGPGTVQGLLDTLAAPMRLLHLCGDEPRAAQRKGIRITRLPIYRASPISQPDLAPALADGPIILVHSPRSARRLAALIDARAAFTLVVISPAAGEAAGIGWQAIHVADTPTDAAMLALAHQLCQRDMR